MKNLFKNKKLLTQISEAEKTDKLQQESDKLNNRFNKKETPYIVKYKPMRNVALAVSYIFNVFSGIGMFLLLSVFLEIIPLPYLNYIIAALVTAGFELYLKRKFSDMFWDEYYATGEYNLITGFINFGLLFAISMAATVGGFYFLTNDAAPESIEIKAQLNALDSKIASHLSNKNKDGEIYWDSQKTLKKLEVQRDELNAALGSYYTAVTDGALAYSTNRKQMRILGFIIMGILFEIMFEICMAFMSKYDYKKSIALALLLKKGGATMKVLSNGLQHFENETAGANGIFPVVVQGFKQKSKQGETANMKQVKQPEVKQPQQAVKQYVPPVLKNVKQLNETSETTEVKQVETSETILIVNTNPRYMKQRCTQNYKRSLSQKDPTTPIARYVNFKAALLAIGIKTIETKDRVGNRTLKYTKI